MAVINVVTGGAGFIGSHIAAHLLRQGQRVRVIDNLLTGKESNLAYLESLGGDLEVHRVSITHLDALGSVFAGADVVYHQAALPSVPRSVANPIEVHEHCVNGTLNVLQAARLVGVRRVVYAASSSAYGDVEGEFKDESIPPAPISPYGAAKLAGEYYCRVFYHSYGLETVALRYFNVFGARQDPASEYAAVIPKFITRMMNGQAPIIYGDGGQTRDFTYIDNIVHGNLLAASTTGVGGEMMNLATGGQISLLDLVEKINGLLGTSFAAIHEPARAGDIRHSRADVSRAAELLDFTPVVSFDEGLARTVDWYRQSQQG